MRVLVIRHHAEDSPGFVGEAFERRGAEIVTRLVPDEGELPPVDGFDFIVLLGAKWSVYDPEVEFINGELAYLRQANETGVPILGICFGAQACAAAFGGRVEKAPEPEVGWFRVTTTEDAPQVLTSGPWFQFHFDRCVLPPGAVLLASSPVGPQAFTVGRNLCVQFHPEVDGSQLQAWIAAGLDEEMESTGVEPAQLLAETAAEEPSARRRADALVGMFIDLSERASVGSRSP